MASGPSDTAPTHVATLKGHTRPVECLASLPAASSGQPSTVYTADSMGVIKIWGVQGQAPALGDSTKGRRVPEISVVPGVGQWERYELLGEIKRHETSIAELVVTSDGLWSGKCCFASDFRYLTPYQHPSTTQPSSTRSRITLRSHQSTTAYPTQHTSSLSFRSHPRSTTVQHPSCSQARPMRRSAFGT